MAKYRCPLAKRQETLRKGDQSPGPLRENLGWKLRERECPRQGQGSHIFFCSLRAGKRGQCSQDSTGSVGVPRPSDPSDSGSGQSRGLGADRGADPPGPISEAASLQLPSSAEEPKEDIQAMQQSHTGSEQSGGWPLQPPHIQA